MKVSLKVVAMTMYENKEAVVELHSYPEDDSMEIWGSLSLYVKGKERVASFDVDQIYEMELTLTGDQSND